jgi:prolyl-tRNA synthetase
MAIELEEAGVRVLLDDRSGVSPGVKFKDAELLGVPTIVVVGRGLTDDPATSTIEVKGRRTGTRTDIPLAQIVSHLAELSA